MAPAYTQKYNTMNNLYDQIISNEYFPNYGIPWLHLERVMNLLERN